MLSRSIGRMVMETYVEFHTDDLPRADRFAAWHDWTSGYVPTLMSPRYEEDFRASARVLSLGDVRVSALAFSELECWRPLKLVRRSDPEQMLVWLGLDAGFGIQIGDQSTLVGARAVTVYDTSRPYRMSAIAGCEYVRGLLIELPRDRLPASGLPPLGASLHGGEGLGGLLMRYVTELVSHAPRYQLADLPRLSTVTVDLLATFLRSHRRSHPAEASQQVLLIRVYDFIERRIGDPRLSPRAVAAAHGISVRALYKLFEGQHRTVAGWIRHRRLERCRHDLTDTGLTSHPIQRIAGRWGFTDAAHFSRIFRNAYGVSPREYRRLVSGADSDLAPADARLPGMSGGPVLPAPGWTGKAVRSST